MRHRSATCRDASRCWTTGSPTVSRTCAGGAMSRRPRRPRMDGRCMRRRGRIDRYLTRPDVTTDSWFVGDNIPGKKRTYLLYTNSAPAYRRKCAEVAANGYEGFAFGKGEE